jgi:hypothetical protein
MIGALAAALLAGPAMAPVPFDLNELVPRAEALDGRWVEFDAYVYWIRTRTPHPVLSALTGVEETLHSGRHVTSCADNNEATLAVIMHGTGLGRLTRRAARPHNAYVGVRIRGIFHNRPYTYRMGGVDVEWGAVVDHASIVRVTGTRCLTSAFVDEEAAVARH